LWAPGLLLGATSDDSTVLVVLAHLYATVLALEPLFPDVGSAFVADLAFYSLEELIRVAQGSQDAGYEYAVQVMTHLMQFPLDMVVSYKAQRDQAQQGATTILPVLDPPYRVIVNTYETYEPIISYKIGYEYSYNRNNVVM
jgi:hypothetical protein